MTFLKEELLNVQTLPSEERYAELQKERQRSVEPRIATIGRGTKGKVERERNVKRKRGISKFDLLRKKIR